MRITGKIFFKLLSTFQFLSPHKLILTKTNKQSISFLLTFDLKMICCCNNRTFLSKLILSLKEKQKFLTSKSFWKFSLNHYSISMQKYPRIDFPIIDQPFTQPSLKLLRHLTKPGVHPFTYRHKQNSPIAFLDDLLQIFSFG